MATGHLPRTISRRLSTALLGLIGLLGVQWHSAAQADIAVIGHPGIASGNLTANSISDLYLGRTRTLPDGTTASLFDLGRDAPLRGRYFLKLTGMSSAQVNAYWSRLSFAGRVQPPRPMADERALIEAVRQTPGAIGYVNSDLVDSKVKVLLVLRE